MTFKTFLFKATIKGENKDFRITVRIENNTVITNHYCPDELLTGNLPSLKAINGESMEDFEKDCQNQLTAMSHIDTNDNLLNIHIAGLMVTIMDHITTYKRLIFGDLLIYMDCFSYLLAADDFSEKEIKEIYVRVTRTIVDLFPDDIKNTYDLSPFKGSFFDQLLC